MFLFRADQAVDDAALLDLETATLLTFPVPYPPLHPSRFNRFAKALSKKDKLQVLIFPEYLGDAGAQEIARWIPGLHLRKLLLPHTGLGEAGARAISACLPSLQELTHLDMSRNRVHDTGAAYLARALKYMLSLEQLQLKSMDITESGAIGILEALPCCPRLTDLDLSGNIIGGHCSPALRAALKGSKLKKLSMRCYAKPEAAGAVAEGIAASIHLKHLDFSGTHIHYKSLEQLMNAVEASVSLEHLSLSHTGLSDDGLILVASAVEGSPSLASLDISDNPCGNRGAIALSAAICFSKTMTSIQVCRTDITDDMHALLETVLRDKTCPVEVTAEVQRRLDQSIALHMTHADSAPAGLATLSPQASLEATPFLHGVHIKRGITVGSSSFGGLFAGTYRGKRVTLSAIFPAHEGLRDLLVSRLLKAALAWERAEGTHVAPFVGVWKDHKDAMYLVSRRGSGRTLLNLLMAEGDRFDEGERMLTTEKDRLMICLGVCRGMQELRAHGIVHGELRAGNVVLVGPSDGSGLVGAKVASYGIATILTNANLPSQFGLLKRLSFPVRYSAPEVLRRGRHSHASDVWSFGVLMWEVFSLGEVPYGRGVTDEQASDYIIRKPPVTLRKPANCPETIYDIMASCWQVPRKLRPSFEDLEASLKAAIDGAATEAQE